ncbi:SpaA isopeptide-forming pilin-related protein [Weissella confusa]|uniref:SpaA isopeptide-forming pilin-related protein n=1 Tax=Weissella confusa TaxID=1583 RepID=UPI00223B7BA2|nr:SpaA isopeptide-forming pilin-related protein [Weissella confusa]MCT0015203.1 hypothetical protein [Weissella confusa]
MAKWKNIALISTIVAPIAFGVGDAFAQANRPTNDSDGTTVVLHKRETQSANDGTDAENLYWGNGQIETGNAFDSWTWEQGVTFTAFNIGKVISINKDGSPKISDDPIPGASGLTWDQVLIPNKGADRLSGNNSAPSDTKSDYVIEFVAKGDFGVQELREALEKQDSKVEQVKFTATDKDGVTSRDLKNGNWIILEDFTSGNPASDDTATFATPIVLSLPMLNASKDGKNDWFGTADSDSYLHLYPKNYFDMGDLRVVKVDGDDQTTAIAGATIALMQLDQAGVADLNAELAAGLLGKDLDDIKSTLSEYAKEDSLVYKEITDADAGVTFTDLMPGETYYVLEVQAPKGYLANSKLQQATLRAASITTGDNTIGTTDDDNDVDHRGGTYQLKNYDIPSLDKDINVLKAGAEELQVNEVKNGKPVYDNKDADYNLTFEDNDTQFGVSRGKPFNYTVDLETNGDIASYTQFGITDIVPYQVEINSWTLYARAGVGGYVKATKDGNEADGLVPILQAVDPDGNETEHSTTDGLSQASQEYNSSDPNPKTRGVSFKFYSQEMATLFGYNGDWINDKNADGYKASLEAQTQYIAANLIDMYGKSGEYHFDSENRAVQTDGSKTIFNGEMHIDFKPPFLQKYASWERFKNASTKQDNASLVFKMNAQTNSAAQANVGGDNTKKDPSSDEVQTDMINNRVAFTFKNGYLTDTLYDQSQTHAVGWEFRKEDSKGNAIGDAGFDLGRVVTKENLDNVVSQLISANNNGHEVKRENLLAMADKLGYTGDDDSKLKQINDHLAGQKQALEAAIEKDGQAMVWFIHLDDTDDKQPVIDAMGSNMEMGDIYWVVDQELSTTHMSGMQDESTPDGYFQYCGVADGRYVLHEAITPKGYKQMDDLKFTIGANDSFYVKDGKSTDDEYPLVTSAGDNQNMGSDNQITGENQGAGQNWAEIKNYKKSVLPVVGGVGALSLLFIGAIAMIASYIKRKTDMREN